MKWLPCLFGKHEWKFVRNIYGDEINVCNGDRSVWRCDHCKGYERRAELYRPIPEPTEPGANA